MILKLENGDYVKKENESAFESIEYTDALLQSIKLILNTERGKFYPDKNFGSHIKNITSQPDDAYALCYARQALDGIDGVFVTKVESNENTRTFYLLINGEERQAEINNESDL